MAPLRDTIGTHCFSGRQKIYGTGICDRCKLVKIEAFELKGHGSHLKRCSKLLTSAQVSLWATKRQLQGYLIQKPTLPTRSGKKQPVGMLSTWVELRITSVINTSIISDIIIIKRNHQLQTRTITFQGKK